MISIEIIKRRILGGGLLRRNILQGAVTIGEYNSELPHSATKDLLLLKYDWCF